MKLKYSSIVVLALVMVCSGLLAWSNLSRTPKVAKKIVAPVAEENEIDPQLVRRYIDITAPFDPAQKEQLLVGSLSVTDGADSTANVHNEPYIFSKQGNDFYYRLGNTETVNATGIYLFVDHQTKKIMLSTQKPIDPALTIPDIKLLIKNLKEEGYALQHKMDGKLEQLTFLNEYHLSCKEYTLSLDIEKQQLTAITMRLSNLIDHENPKMDKLIELNLSKVSNLSDIGHYVSQKQFVVREGNSWKPASDYRDYELILL